MGILGLRVVGAWQPLPLLPLLSLAATPLVGLGAISCPLVRPVLDLKP